MPRRSPPPQGPTCTQAGLPGWDIGLWFGLLAPAGTPSAAMDRLKGKGGKILTSQDFREKVATQGLKVLASTPEQYGARLKAEYEKFARIIKAAGIQPE